MLYRYELHCHTQEGSKCSTLPMKEMIEFYRQMGYSGVCITDHFSGSMNPLPNEAPWDERVMFFYNAYQKARKAGEKFGLSVFFGIEYAIAPDIHYMSETTGTHFLLLNLTKEWLMENKAAFCGPPSELFMKIREADGFVIHAHPFLEKKSIECIRLYPRCIDAVEVLNSSCNDFVNSTAQAYARAYGILETAGSDCHSANQRNLAGVETSSPCLSLEELITAIKTRRAHPFLKYTGDSREADMNNDVHPIKRTMEK